MLAALGLTAALVVPVQVVLAPLASAAPGTGVEGRYIVTLKENAYGRAKARAYAALQDLDGAFTAKLSKQQVSKLRRDPAVAEIEQDALYKTTGKQYGASWGLARIGKRKPSGDRSYTYRNTGAQANAYIIDSGIDFSHPDFGGRASAAFDAVGDGRNGRDCAGHGTHVAGIVGGARYGVAKEVRLHSVRVMNCKGWGYTSDIIAGTNWVRRHHGPNAVANMSIGGSKSRALNRAVTRLHNSGVFVVVAAGNDNRDASKDSPASASAVETVGATTSTDKRARFSNHGKVVDIWAPGVNISSDVPGGRVQAMSGTSMAAPFVAGVAALYKSTHGGTSSGKLSAWLHRKATKKKIQKLPRGSYNRLLHTGGL